MYEIILAESAPVVDGRAAGRAALLTQQPTTVRAPATPRGIESSLSPQSGLTPVGMTKMESSMVGLSVNSPPKTGTSGGE